MTNRALWTFAAFLLVPVISLAQTMEPTKTLEMGDKASYAWKNRSESETVIFEVVEVNGVEVKMVERRGAKTGDRIYVSDKGGFSKSLCWAIHEQCTFSSPNLMVVFPLEKGKKWTNSQSSEGESWKADTEKKHKVVRLQKVKVSAGEFEAYKIKFSGKVTGTTNAGQKFKISEKATYWYALVNGKPVMVKLQYSNSNKDKVSMELTSVRYK